MLKPVPRPLVITADPALLEDLLRLSAAAGVDPRVANDAVAARAVWSGSPVVLVGTDAAAPLARARLPRRQAVLLVGRDPDDASVWAAGASVGAERVLVLPGAEDEVVRHLSGGGGPHRCTVVGVVGGRGGAGSSTTAVALALAGVRSGRRTLLLDADPWGGGIDLLLGGEAAGGLRWGDLATARGQVSGSALTGELPRLHGLHVLSWDRGAGLTVPVDAMQTVLAAARSGTDLVVVDLPRRPDEATALAVRACDVVLVVVPGEVRAVASAGRVVTAVREHATDLRCVVRAPATPGLDGRTVAEALGLPLEGWLGAEPGLAVSIERGEPPGRRVRGPLARFCDGFLADRVAVGAAA